MPAVIIRQLDALEKVMACTTTSAQRDVPVEQARGIQTSSTDALFEAAERDEVARSYQAVLAAREAAERSAS